MKWLVIVFVLLFTLSPVLWLRPSPQQKRRMTLRDRLTRQGVTIRETTPPLHHFKGTMPTYRWFFPAEAPGPTFLLVRDAKASAALEPYHAGWRWRIAPLRPLSDKATYHLKRIVEKLPQDALVLESTPESISLWWWESQNGERFATYLADFEALRDALEGRADKRPIPFNARVDANATSQHGSDAR